MRDPTPHASRRWRPPIPPDDFIHEDLPAGSKFGDDEWDYQGIRPLGNPGRWARFTRIPEGYRHDVKLYALLQGRPHHPTAVVAGVMIRKKVGSMDAILSELNDLAVVAAWGERKGLHTFGEWSPGLAEDFLDDLRKGEHRENGKPNAPSSVRGFVSLLKHVRNLAPLAQHPLPFQPWPAQSAAEVAEESMDGDNKTPPLPWETWQPLMVAADTIITRLSPLIIDMQREFRAARPSDDLSRGVTRQAAIDTVRARLDDGYLIPLHTGVGRSKQFPRGSINFSQIWRTLGVSENIRKRTSHNYTPEAIQLIDDAFAAGNAEFGGLMSSAGTWTGEIGLAEAEHLPGVLRAACYIMISSLSGMRDSEIQALRRDAFDISAVIPSVKSMTYKAQGVNGKARSWWVPSVVQTAVDVLEQLSLTERLFSRSGKTGEGGEEGAYVFTRDLKRLIAFVNAAPAERVGRGEDLGFQPITLRSRDAINATSLRRTLAVYAATYPGAEIGVGIQLGKASLRATSGYVRDQKHAATQAITDERRQAIRKDLQRLLFSGEPIAGPSGDYLENVRVQVIADPRRADQIIARVAQNYTLGVVNDCAYREKTAACGPGGPKLADHVCFTTDCANAVLHGAHLPIWERQLARHDRALDAPNLHPKLEANLRRDRAKIVAEIRALRPPEVLEELE
ncbi:hypothetical protein [Microbacterium sp. GCS4]|uniref:hypothetical protein n=1 Tax=Microbacterium sp. GCS4 TaxID=1692239 RepID=UPI000A5B720F|nr:hypothetical protein [Microbacterium sp. GCS4]